MSSSFSKNLLRWYPDNKRDLPWNHTKDPYKIWISEIILQQTRVEQGLPYYERFIKQFPNVKLLAEADLEQVLKLWQGLGYYSRARNIHFTAKLIRDEYKGVFPTDYNDILALKGIGKYTAAAVGSFAFDLPYPVVDGNVQRVLSRCYALGSADEFNKYLKEIDKKIEDVFDGKHAADFNRAIMNLGSQVCTPKNPNCEICPQNKICKAFKTKKIVIYPPKKPKVKVQERYFHYLDFRHGQRTILKQRDAKDIWAKLFEFPMIETKSTELLDVEQIEKLTRDIIGIKDLKLKITIGKKATQKLTHRKIFAQFYEVEIAKKKGPTILNPHYIWADQSKLKNFAVHKLIAEYISNHLSKF